MNQHIGCFDAEADDPGKQFARDKPTGQAHLNNGNEGGVLLESGHRSAGIIYGCHVALP
ncbi:hypothetical protein [Rhodoblastus sp.]|uniref:hypothetical protein n=1 Tax=Rhodoblastus sp. TaxID=1962975 RepID=UPI002601F288|nr:hypothetical protein [Rhodoblastus sp.]